jgi:hypothetical protein
VRARWHISHELNTFESATLHACTDGGPRGDCTVSVNQRFCKRRFSTRAKRNSFLWQFPSVKHDTIHSPSALRSRYLEPYNLHRRYSITSRHITSAHAQDENTVSLVVRNIPRCHVYVQWGTVAFISYCSSSGKRKNKLQSHRCFSTSLYRHGRH